MLSTLVYKTGMNQVATRSVNGNPVALFIACRGSQRMKSYCLICGLELAYTCVEPCAAMNLALDESLILLYAYYIYIYRILL